MKLHSPALPLLALVIALTACAITLATLEDVLGIGGEGRTNRPGQPSGNWRCRVRDEALADALADRLDLLTATYDRS